MLSRLVVRGAVFGTAAAFATAASVSAAKPQRQICVDCYYSLSSPWMYLGGPRLDEMARKHNVKLLLKPFDFQAVAPQAGGIPLRTRPEARKTYHADELRRWSQHLDMPLNLEPAHYKPNFSATTPVDPNWNKYAGWMVIAAQNQGADASRLSHALLRALWAEERDTTDPAVRIAVADENGLDGKALHALEQSPETLATYASNTREALDVGIFGAPTFVVDGDGERFWGQDRLDFVDRKLERLRANEAARYS